MAARYKVPGHNAGIREPGAENSVIQAPLERFNYFFGSAPLAGRRAQKYGLELGLIHPVAKLKLLLGLQLDPKVGTGAAHCLAVHARPVRAAQHGALSRVTAVGLQKQLFAESPFFFFFCVYDHVVTFDF